MKKYFLILAIILFSIQTLGEESSSKITSLDELMKMIEKEKIEQRKEFQQRKIKFQKEKNIQQKLLNQAALELIKEEKQGKILQKEYEKHEKELVDLENELQIIVGSLGELFGVVKQVAGDLRGHILSSIVSSQIKNRQNFLNKISDRKKLPNIQELRRLWLELQLEATELGQVRKFKSQIVLNNGDKKEAMITRVGGFNLVSDGEYLTYLSETGQIMELSKQPARSFLSYIKKFESSKDQEYRPFAIDPSSGSLLSVLLRVPTLGERLAMGGLVGYIIILIFFIGVGIVIHRTITLRKETIKIKEQLQSDEASPDNPVGKLRIAFEQNRNSDAEVLEIKLEEVIIQSLPLFEKGISTVKILAAVAPLLGLLGTVIGMIVTFQSITLFGTGDPKLMAGGISQALITTVLGLCCAIPLLLLYNFISGKSKEVTQLLEEQAAGLIAQKIEDKNK